MALIVAGHPRFVAHDGTPYMLSVAERMASRLAVSDGGCWEWQGHRDLDGYGMVSFRGKPSKAHRIAWLVVTGFLPDRPFKILHDCDNPACCNPDHLYCGTQADNMRDKISRCRGNAAYGSRHGHARLSEQDIPRIRMMLARGGELKQIGSLFGITGATVWAIKSGRTWRHVP